MNLKYKYALSITILIVLIFVVTNYLIGTYFISPSQSKISNEKKKLNFEDVSFYSKSGSLIKGWYAKGDFDTLGIILMHGNGGNRLDMLGRAAFLNNAGFSVLLFDFQAHGESKGKIKTFGYLESNDAKAANHFMREKKGCKRIGVIGFSLGGAATILGNKPMAADAYVFESVYPNIQKAISNRLKIKFGEIGSLLTPFLTLQLKYRLGFDLDQLSPISKVSDLKSPVLVITGSLDERTTIKDSKDLYDSINAEKSLWVIKRSKHEDFFKFKGEEYKTKIVDFFVKQLVNKNQKNN